MKHPALNHFSLNKLLLLSTALCLLCSLAYAVPQGSVSITNASGSLSASPSTPVIRGTPVWISSTITLTGEVNDSDNYGILYVEHGFASDDALPGILLTARQITSGTVDSSGAFSIFGNANLTARYNNPGSCSFYGTVFSISAPTVDLNFQSIDYLLPTLSIEWY